ncbi:MAG TPA: hypothetical protein VGO47_02265 [Chlamydiales bacterium]|jgi:hypothetical protein|nr:hypothetical protein [Chlamydiales bacterium]
MTVLMQGRLFRSSLATFGASPLLGFLGFRRVTNDTKSPKSEQSRRVGQILRKFTNPEPLLPQNYISSDATPNQSCKPLLPRKNSCNPIDLYRPSRRSMDTRFVYNPPIPSELGKEEPMGQWDEALYD